MQANINNNDQLTANAEYRSLSKHSDSIKVLHFERQNDSLADLNLQQTENAQESDRLVSLKLEPSKSETKVKESLNQSTQLVSRAGSSGFQHITNSLKNSLSKKKGNCSDKQSDFRTRSFNDVLNAMRDTEEIEEEKRQIMIQERRQATR